ncbi:MAG: hypothetical protein JWQ88_677 [Rhodoferax sp.]|nr:hypothetical protein [Rhodoferax sp.]
MQPQRFDAVDALRGLAMVWMTAFHFCFDLQNFGYLRQDFYNDPLWTWQRTCILSLFLFCAGLGQGIAVLQGQSWPRFWRRWRLVAVCALLVTAGSFVMFPRSFIYFGVLHGLVVMLIVARLTAGWGRWLWLAGLLAIASPLMAEQVLAGTGVAAWFNARPLNWIGWITRKPITEDFVPMFPWLGVMWWGLASAEWFDRVNRVTPKTGVKPAELAARPLPGPAGLLARLGRWSLPYYMLHQPVMIALVAAWSATAGRP